MSVINTNITSMIGQQNLRESQNALQTSMERLSSGLRINSAKDDAAGQAIANRMSSQITGLGQAQRNANDGISVSQTAEGGLDQVNDNLQRIRELSVQAQNGTNSSDDLDSIQDEINQRLSEIDRISSETDFNGTKVLASDSGLKIQVGADDGQTIEVNLKQINAETLGLQGFNVNESGTPNSTASTQDLAAAGFVDQGNGVYKNATFNEATTAGDLFENLQDDAVITRDPAAAGDGTIAYTLDEATNTFSFDQTDVALTKFDSDLGLTPGAGETNTVTVNLGGAETKVDISSSGTLTNAETGENLYLTGTSGSKDLSETSAGGSQATIDDLVTELGAATGTASITNQEGTVYSAGATAGNIDTSNETIAKEDLLNQINSDATNDYDFDLDGAGTAGANTEYNITTADVVKDGQNGALGAATYTSGFEGDFSLSATQESNVYANDNGKITDGAANEIYVNDNGALSLEATSGSNKTEDPLATLDAALSQVDSLRSELGAVQNRFESAITNLSTNQTNLSAARSRIEDADYATEVADMTKNQILQQAGTSVLAQANQLPQNVLSLLG
ncbi:flagellin [Vreelandella janggokensis]|uniref:flagellin N-terminal helical domain-containing protein n=1 Tax=Vreelandella janggokensis TaxID=370767 RepID=UPI00285F494A|nr:flagellin [Halomonas janggokensis]MDR5887795.1 flagellin [Halomonas janggokensis]